jgi:hypothetical protein
MLNGLPHIAAVVALTLAVLELGQVLVRRFGHRHHHTTDHPRKGPNEPS